ncbi:hypothetical protein V8E54_004096 [Elaphomyces granulatus]
MPLTDPSLLQGDNPNGPRPEIASLASVRRARTQPVIRAKKRKAPRDPAVEEDDAKLRLLAIDTEIRWHSFLYHAWSNFQEAIGKIYGDIEPESTEWVWARGRFQDGIKRYKNMVLDKMEAYLKQLVTDQSHLQYTTEDGIIAELKKQFNKENFFHIFYYMHGYLDFDTTTHQNAIWVVLGAEVWKYIKAGADKNARDNLLKAYDLVPLHDNLKRMKRRYLEAKKDRSKRQRVPKKTPDLSPLAGMNTYDPSSFPDPFKSEYSSFENSRMSLLHSGHPARSRGTWRLKRASKIEERTMA